MFGSVRECIRTVYGVSCLPTKRWFELAVQSSAAKYLVLRALEEVALDVLRSCRYVTAHDILTSMSTLE